MSLETDSGDLCCQETGLRQSTQISGSNWLSIQISGFLLRVVVHLYDRDLARPTNFVMKEKKNRNTIRDGDRSLDTLCPVLDDHYPGTHGSSPQTSVTPSSVSQDDPEKKRYYIRSCRQTVSVLLWVTVPPGAPFPLLVVEDDIDKKLLSTINEIIKSTNCWSTVGRFNQLSMKSLNEILKSRWKTLGTNYPENPFFSNSTFFSSVDAVS